METRNFREYLNFDKSYYTINREERNLTTILFHLLLEEDNLQIFLKEIGIDVPKALLQSPEFGIYPEYAFIRDLWNNIDKKGSNDENNALKKRFILDFLPPHFKDSLENLLNNQEFNEYFGSDAKNNISSPMRWSEKKFSETMNDNDRLEVCKFKWCFKAQPDIVIHLSKNKVICIEAKLESSIGSYSCKPHDNTSQLEIQEKVMEYLGFVNPKFILISKNGHEENVPENWKKKTWKDIFKLFDASNMPTFIQETINKYISE